MRNGLSGAREVLDAKSIHREQTQHGTGRRGSGRAITSGSAGSREGRARTGTEPGRRTARRGAEEAGQRARPPRRESGLTNSTLDGGRGTVYNFASRPSSSVHELPIPSVLYVRRPLRHEFSLAAQSFRVTGEVTDSIHRTPLSSATVIATPVAPTRDTVFHATRTDAKGRFSIEGLQAGRYIVSVEHAFTDSIGLTAPSREAEASLEGALPLALAIPSVATLRKTLCRAAESDTTLGVILGAVRRSNGSTVGGATVVFVWTDIEADRTKTGSHDDAHDRVGHDGFGGGVPRLRASVRRRAARAGAERNTARFVARS